MAESEIYRVEIPIIVDDQSEAPIERARERVNRFQRSAEKTNERLRRMAAREYRFRMTTLDRLSPTIQKVQRNLSSVTRKTWTITLQAKDKATDIIKRAIGTVTSPLALLGAGYGIYSSFAKTMNFEAQMSSIKALTGISAKELGKLQGLAIKMGANTKYSALEAAQGIEELLKAGLSVKQIMDGGLEAALNLAAAGGLELADAAEIMSTAMNAFKNDAMTAAQAANILAGTANASATSVQELQYSLAMVSAVASGVGMSFRDTNVALGLFANNGLKGSDAGTALKTMLMNLIPQTKQQIEMFKKLGLITKSGTIAFFDTKGKLKSLADIAGLLKTRLKNLSQAQRMAALEIMFGSDAIRAANILFKEGAEGVLKFTKEMSKVTALDVAKEKMNNAAGAVEQFRGAVETLQISALMPLMPLIREFALWAADMAEKYTPQITKKFEEMSKKIKQSWGAISADPAFQKMDFGDKIIYILNLALDKVSKWLDGEGGKKVQTVFAKIGAIAAKAWIEGLEGMVQASVSSFASGNILGGIGMLGLASALGLGLLVRGTIGAGKGLFAGGKWMMEGIDKLMTSRAAARIAALEKTNPLAAEIIRGTYGIGKTTAPATKAAAASAKVVKTTTPAATTAAQVAQKGWVRTASGLYIPAETVRVAGEAAEEVTAISKGVGKTGFLSNIKIPGFVGKAGKFLGKAALPLTLITEGIEILRARDKVKATIQGIGGLGGSFAGAKLGAMIGTAIAPGIGTAIGGALGGIGGYIVGHWLGGEAVNVARFGTVNAPISNVPVKSAVPSKTPVVIQIQATSKPVYNITTAVNAQDVLKIIKNNEKTIADQLSDEIGEKLASTFNNIPLTPVWAK
ncbi:phage tail tape measure protein [Carboxydocella sp. ULO1]|uniref:phage tail tape measure protein n=1 Tax=Carboxydocella sp. ULO1 TaxID=1926599 RepID=UPI0009CC6691|nr:phage tail tape measure protein [Carboxydocella sp. ULO1]GAW27993.1 phage tail tape measure protein [Carboxydocella sp. ULO1]